MNPNMIDHESWFFNSEQKLQQLETEIEKLEKKRNAPALY
jgi:hypothetical protein